MFEYVIHRTYLNRKGALVEDQLFNELIYDNLENAVAKETILSLTDPKGIYYIEHRVRLEYEGNNI